MPEPADLPLVIADLLTEALDLHTHHGPEPEVYELVDIARRLRAAPSDDAVSGVGE